MALTEQRCVSCDRRLRGLPAQLLTCACGATVQIAPSAPVAAQHPPVKGTVRPATRLSDPPSRQTTEGAELAVRAMRHGRIRRCYGTRVTVEVLMRPRLPEDPTPANLDDAYDAMVAEQHRDALELYESLAPFTASELEVFATRRLWDALGYVLGARYLRQSGAIAMYERVAAMSDEEYAAYVARETAEPPWVPDPYSPEDAATGAAMMRLASDDLTIDDTDYWASQL